MERMVVTLKKVGNHVLIDVVQGPNLLGDGDIAGFQDEWVSVRVPVHGPFWWRDYLQEAADRG